MPDAVPTVPILRQELARVWSEAEILRLIRLRSLSARLQGRTPGPEASVQKLLADEHGQHVMAASQNLVGAGAMGAAHAENLAHRTPGATVTSVYDVAPARAAEVAGLVGARTAESAEQLIAEGERRGLERGRLEGLRDGITAALSARAVPLSEFGRARLASCADIATLTRWLTRAVTATSEAEVFASTDAP